MGKMGKFYSSSLCRVGRGPAGDQPWQQWPCTWAVPPWPQGPLGPMGTGVLSRPCLGDQLWQPPAHPVAHSP